MKSILPAVFLTSIAVTTAAIASVNSPVLKWVRAGCYSSWCETGWYSSPAVADLNGDGVPEVVAGAYTVNILRGTDGAVVASFNKNGSRVWSGIIVADINNDGKQEIAAASGGLLIVRNFKGDSLWTKTVISNELRGAAAADLDASGKLQLVVCAAQSDSLNTWVYSSGGTLAQGWPQRSKTKGYSAGVYNDNVAIGNLTGGTKPDIVVPSDVHYICAYTANGAAIPASSLFGTKTWGEVGVWVDTAPEMRGYGACNGVVTESYRANFAEGAAVIADVNNDGVPKVVVTGNVYDCNAGYPPSKYTGVFIFNPDRTRFKSGAFDWTIPPAIFGAPICEDYNIIESCLPDPVVADIDGDGMNEILFSSYDGKVHAVHLDKTEHGNWPFSVYHAGDPFFRFASPPVVVDLDNDGKAEVLFTTWTQKGSNATGDLFVLDYLGNLLYKVALPSPFGGATWNGGLASPTVDKIDTSGDLAIVVNTAASGIVAYDLPGTKNARVLWGTGRANYRRDGNVFNSNAAVKPWQYTTGSLPGKTFSKLRCYLGGTVRILEVPFRVETGFAAEVFDAAGKKIPSLVKGTDVLIAASRSELCIIRMSDIDGKVIAVVKVPR
jgi:FG-GAP-like repeat/FG-GAP repeat